MAAVNTYLNFTNQTEDAFNFYKSVFGTEFIAFSRFRDIPQNENMPQMPEPVLDLVMHIALPITAGHILMGTDAPEQMGFKVITGNNVYISINTDSREETQRLFAALSEGGQVEQELQDMFWGDYYGSCRDKFGIQWMFNFH